MFGTMRRLAKYEHDEEHAACEHLDGAVPFVVCTCGEAFGYHVGHEGDWRTCDRGYCHD